MSLTKSEMLAYVVEELFSVYAHKTQLQNLSHTGVVTWKEFSVKVDNIPYIHAFEAMAKNALENEGYFKNYSSAPDY